MVRLSTSAAKTSTAFFLASIMALLLVTVVGRDIARSQTSSQSGPRAEESLHEAARLRGLALAEMEDGRYDEALPLLQELEELLPDNILPPLNRAICLYQLQRPAEAQAAADRARGLDPSNPRLLYALATILASQGAQSEWQQVLEQFATTHPTDPRPHYLLATGELRSRQDPAAVRHLQAALDRAPENLVLMTELLGTAAQAGDSESLGDALDAIEDRLNGFDEQQAEYATQIRAHIDGEDPGAAAPPATVLRNLLRPSELYQIYRVPLTGGRQGRAPLFPQLDFEPALPKSVQGGQDISLAFVDASRESGLSELPAVDVGVVHRTPGEESLLVFGDGTVSWLAYDSDGFHQQQLAAPDLGSGPTIAYDIDQDALSDLVIADSERGLLLYSGAASPDSSSPTAPPGGFTAPRTMLPAAELGAVNGLLPVDLDHDGDLDLLVLRAGDNDLYLQNNGDGSWSERGREMALAGPAADTTAMAVADFDEDGDLDLVTAQPEHGLRLLLNPIVGPFEDASETTALSDLQIRPHGVLATDVDNDGRFDLVTWDDTGGRLLHNGPGGFEPIALPELESAWRASAASDFDNDGDQDLVVLEASGRLTLLRNRRGTWSAEPSAVHDPAARSLLVADLDADGDLDLQTRRDDGRLRWWRNDGGNRNQWLRISLRGQRDNNSKNNTQGLFSRIETRSGDAYQALLGNGGVNHLGLGSRRQADVLRVVWTNGVAQIWQQVSARRTLVEEQVLKGSCPFLYTWNGREFRFPHRPDVALTTGDVPRRRFRGDARARHGLGADSGRALVSGGRPALDPGDRGALGGDLCRSTVPVGRRPPGRRRAGRGRAVRA